MMGASLLHDALRAVSLVSHRTAEPNSDGGAQLHLEGCGDSRLSGLQSSSDVYTHTKHYVV
jgi:hypothetical protein